MNKKQTKHTRKALCRQDKTPFEEEKTFGQIEYACCNNVDSIMSMGYSSLPVLIMVTDKVYDVETDTSILIDEDELQNWIEARI